MINKDEENHLMYEQMLMDENEKMEQELSLLNQ